MKSEELKQKPPTVSICMIAYQIEQYIGKAIESIMMQQTTFDIQLVIGEDSSTDKTREICEEYALKYGNKIKLLPSDRHYGIQHNYYRTLKACTGNYIAFCDGDDYWTDPNKLQKQVEFLEQNPKCVLTFHPVDTYYEQNGTINKEVAQANTIFYEGKDVFHLHIPTLSVVFKNCIESFPREFFEDNFPDIFLFGIISSYGAAAQMSFVGATYRKHSNGVYSGLKKFQQFKKIIQTRRLMYNSSFFNNDQKSEIKKEIKRKKVIYIKNFITHNELLNCVKIIFA